MLHPSLRSIDAVTGATVAELRDEGLELSGFAFSPLPGRHADRDHPRADRRAASGDLGRSHGRGDRPAARAARAGRARRLVARRLGAAPAPARRRPAPPPPLRPRDRRGHACSRPSRARSRRRPSGPTARSGTASTTACTRRRCSRSGSTTPLLEARGIHARPRAGRSSRGGSRTPTASASTGSSSGPTGDGPVPGDDAGARRAALARHGPLGARRPRPRRRRASSSRWSTTAGPTGSGRRGATS